MLGTLKKIFAFAGNRKGLLKKSLFFSFLNGIFASFQFGALYFIVDALASDNHNLTSVWLALGMMMLSIAGRIFSSFFSMNEQTVVGYGMVADKRISIGDRLRYIPMGYFNKNNIGTITGIVTTTLGDVESSAPVALVNMIGGFFNSVVLILFLLLFNWQLGLVALVGVVCYLLVTEAATRKSTSTAEKRQSAQRGLVEAVLEYIQGMGVVKSFGFEKDSSQSIAAAIRDSNTPYADVELETTYDYNPDKANQLLDEAGWVMNESTGIREKDGEPLNLLLTLESDYSATSMPTAEVIKSQLAEVGIDVTIYGTEQMQWYADYLEGKFDLTLWHSQFAFASPHCWFTPMDSMVPQTPSLPGIEGSDEFLATIKNLTNMVDEQEVRDTYTYLFNFDIGTALDIPLTYQKDMIVYNTDKISGYTFTGTPYFFDILSLEPAE